MSMNAQIKIDWIKNLLSGKYKQGKEELKTKKGAFCCLGVLCDMFIHTLEGHRAMAHWGITRDGDRIFYYADKDGKMCTGRGTLPLIVQNWAELLQFNPDVHPKKGETCTLAAYNDGAKASGTKPHTFKQIAKIIKEQL